MGHRRLLLLGILLVTACSREGSPPRLRSNTGPTAGTGGPERPRTTPGPTRAPPSRWSLADMAGTYAWRCVGDLWAETTLVADGTFSMVLHGKTGELTQRGKIVREGDQLTLSDQPAHLAGYLSHYVLREHLGRKMLVREDAVASFDLLPSWWLGSVRLGPGETRPSLCKKMPPRPRRNPPDPADGKRRLPVSFTVTFPMRDPGGVSTVKVDVTSAPWWVEAAVCHRCTVPTKLSLDPSPGWAKLNRLWWTLARATGPCPAVHSKEPFTLSYGGRTIQGNLPARSGGTTPAKDPCQARYQLVRWVSSRVQAMHPPSR